MSKTRDSYYGTYLMRTNMWMKRRAIQADSLYQDALNVGESITQSLEELGEALEGQNR